MRKLTTNDGTMAVTTYIASFPPQTQTILNDIRQLLKRLAPFAQEHITYGIPTFSHNGVHLFHFAAYPHHIGWYPTAQPISHFASRLSSYKTSKGAVQFPFTKPMPFTLIEDMARYRLTLLPTPV